MRPEQAGASTPHAASGNRQPRLGLIVNPIAGMGGAVALHGTDQDRANRAQKLGAAPIALSRAARALRRVVDAVPDIVVLTSAGQMGEEIAEGRARTVRVIHQPEYPSTAEDTRQAAKSMENLDPDLILFAGGDGTAADIVASVGTRVPILGVPTGVKMHSSVFATSPESGGDIAGRYLYDPGTAPTSLREVVDRTPEGVVTIAAASVPYVSGSIQGSKSSPAARADQDLVGLCADIANQLVPGRLYLLGPGTTTLLILDHLGLPGTLEGVDVVLDGEVIHQDATEDELLYLLAKGRDAKLVLGVVGGQGFLLGRGNQQLSPRVIRLVGEDNVLILASEEKLRRLDPAVLRVDIGDAEADPLLLGYRRVFVGRGRSLVMKVVN